MSDESDIEREIERAKEQARKALRLECTCAVCCVVIPPEDAPLWAIFAVELAKRVTGGRLLCKDCSRDDDEPDA